MKKILFLLLLLISLTGFGQTKWYVDESGSDAHGDGTAGDPWATIKHAADTITQANGLAGDTIYVNAGSYTIGTQVLLSDSIHLKGAGVTTVITSTITGSPYYAIKAASTEGTIGNQTISYIKMVGSGTAFSPLGISGRSSVSVHHCTFENFYDRGICFAGTTDFASAKPTIFATNNSFHDNIVTNCATGVSYGRGNLNIGGQSGMLIYNNTIHQNDRGAGYNGFGIKALYYGYNKGVKIYDNSIYVPRREGSEWDFSIELLHNLGGIEIYNNDILGRLDVSATTPPGGVFAATDEGGYGFALKIYDNLIGHDSLCSGTEVGIDLEHDITGGVYIYRNHIRNVYKGIALTMSGNQEDVYIYYNLIDSIGQDGTTQGQGIGFSGTGSVDNLHVYNNVILGHPDEATLSGIYKVVAGNVTNSSIRNNIFRYFDDAPMDFENATFNTISIENNIFYNNGSSNNITWTGTSQTDVTEQNNYKVDPLFIGGSPYSYKLQETSPARDAGLSVGLTSDYGGYSVPIGALPDIGAWEYGADVDPPNWSEQGIGWDRTYNKVNFRDSINFTRGFMIAGVPISSSGSGLEILGGLTASVDDLNNTSGSTGNLQGQINALDAIDDSKADTSLSNLSSVAINTHLLPATSGSANLGSALLPFGSVYANGTVSLPSTTSIGSVSSTEIGYVNNVTSAIQTQFNATKTRIDSIVTVLADTANIETLLQIDFDTDTLADLSEVRLKLNIADSLTKYVTPSQLSDSIDAAVGVIISDVRDEIADSLNVLRPTVRLLADTIPLFVFGAGGYQLSDTAVFSDSTIYGAFYNSGSDTLVITQLKCIMLGEAGDTLGVDINWSDTLQAVVPTELNTTPHPFGYTSSGKVGSTDTSFNNTKIPPNKWIWCDTPFISAGHKPKYFNAQISGYKIPKY